MRTKEEKEAIAKEFLMWGILEWGQDESKRAKVTGDYLRAAGFKVENSGFPVFAGMFPQQPITGEDGGKAYSWLKRTLDTLQRGKFELELEQLTEAL